MPASPMFPAAIPLEVRAAPHHNTRVALSGIIEGLPMREYVIGSTPPSSSYRSRPVAQLQPTLFYVASPRHALLRVPVPF